MRYATSHGSLRLQSKMTLWQMSQHLCRCDPVTVCLDQTSVSMPTVSASLEYAQIGAALLMDMQHVNDSRVTEGLQVHTSIII